MTWDDWTTQQENRSTKRRDVVDDYRDDPVAYFTHELGVTPWSRQEGILRDLAAHDRVAVASGHKVSKSNTAAGASFWWSATRPGSRTILTAPTFTQVKKILWKEIGALHPRVRDSLGGVVPKDPLTGITFANGSEVFGVTTDDPDNLGGYSGEDVLWIVDEGSGFDDGLFEAIEGNAAGGVKILVLGNPLRTTGWFHEVFRGRRGKWVKHHISSEESPNVTAKRVVIPGLAVLEWIERMREQHGPDYTRSTIYQRRVMGQFPEHASDAVIGIAMMNAAQRLWPTMAPSGRLRVGVDVARFGDDETVIQPVRGRYAYPAKTLRGADGPEVAGHVIAEVRRLANGETAVPVNVDGIGVGASAYDSLQKSPAAHGGDIEVFDVQASAAATDTDDESPDDAEERESAFHNLRAQLWFAVGDWLNSGGAVPPDADLEQELLAPKFFYDMRGRKQVEAKKDIKKKIGRSPDRADALALAIYHAPRGFEFRPFRVLDA